MPTEYRDIHFTLAEIKPVFLSRKAQGTQIIPPKLVDISIVEAAHTVDLENGFHERRQRMEALVEGRAEVPGVIFRGHLIKNARRFKEVGFFVPDSVLQTVLIETCMLSNIRLPRVGDKAVVADGLTVGLRITLADRKLMLDDDPAGQPIA